jgi:glyceraldehyde 3-phosphate dehydrogenase
MNIQVAGNGFGRFGRNAARVAFADDDIQLVAANDRAASSTGPLAGVLDCSDEPLVSSDTVGSPASCTFDSGLTMALDDLIKIFGGWYDNNCGYSNCEVALAVIVGSACR